MRYALNTPNQARPQQAAEPGWGGGGAAPVPMAPPAGDGLVAGPLLQPAAPGERATAPTPAPPPTPL